MDISYSVDGHYLDFETLEEAIQKAKTQAEQCREDISVTEKKIVATVKYPVPDYEVVRHDLTT